MNQRSKPPPSTIIALALITILGIVCIVAGLTVLQLPNSVTENGDKVELLYLPVLIISLVVFWGVTSGIIWAVFRYRRKSEDEELPEQIHGSSVLEATWTAIPIIILVALFIPAFILVLDIKTTPDEEDIDVRVEAIGHQWWWEFAYPDDGVGVQQTPPDYENLEPPTLVLPVDQTVLITVRSTDVVHSFSAPNTLYKIQAIPGNVNEMHVKFEDTGVFYGQCYQFCGTRHSDMLFLIDVREQADYEAWLAETQAAQGVTPPDLAAASED